GPVIPRPRQPAAWLHLPSALRPTPGLLRPGNTHGHARGRGAGRLSSVSANHRTRTCIVTREHALARAAASFDSGEFKTTLARRVAIPTESQNPERKQDLADYLDTEMRPAFESMGFTCQTLTHPLAKAPFLYAERIEDPGVPTTLGYGHGDVIRGLDAEWKPGVGPWTLAESEGMWYGRGIADNKGQHTVNMEALRMVLETRGRLG